MLCGLSCKAFWLATSIMFYWWFKDFCLPCFSLTAKPNQIPQLSHFLVESSVCEFCIAALHHYSCLCINGITLFWSISLNMLLISARLESNCQVNIQRQADHVSSSPVIVITSHYIASYLHSEATMKQLWCILPFILIKYHWFACWINKDLWLLCKLSCHSCCSCWFMHSECEKQWM